MSFARILDDNSVILNPSKRKSSVDMQTSVQEMARVLVAQGFSELLEKLQRMVVM